MIERPNLVSALEDADPTVLRAIVAPTGWGKSELVAQWLAAHARPVAFVGLDHLDDEATRCWTHLLSAAGAAAGVDVDDLLDALRAPGVPLVPDVVEPLLARLADHEITLVLEDLQAVQDVGVRESIEALVDARPASLLVAVVSRVEPSLHLPRRRVRGEVVEVRLDDLRVGVDDGTVIVAQASGEELTPDLVGQLVTRTEGWPAGLYLAGLSLRSAPSAAEFVSGFTGDDHNVSEYLASEVLATFGDPDLDFLLTTSVLDELDPVICDRLLDRDDSAAVLASLARENLFLVPTGGQSFRHHRLFRQWLELEHARRGADGVAEARRRAASVYGRRGDGIRAVDQALQSGDQELAFRYVMRNSLPMIDSGDHSTVGRWCNALRSDYPDAEMIRLSLVRAWVAIIDGDLDEVARSCAVARQRVERLGSEGFDRLNDGEIALIEAYGNLLRGAIDKAGAGVDAARAAGVSARPNATLAWVAAAVGYWRGERDEQTLLVARQLASATGDPYADLLCEAYMAHVDLDRLDTSGAVTHIDASMRVAAEYGLATFGYTALARLARARADFANGDLDAARSGSERSVELAERRGDMPAACLARLVSAEVNHAAGDRDEARRLLRVAESDLRPLNAGRLLDERLEVVERQLRLNRKGGRTQLPSGPVEELTDREMALLRLLPGDLNQRELGQALYVSLNTVKTYNRQIYRKLGVASRDDAVATARTLGLLS